VLIESERFYIVLDVGNFVGLEGRREAEAVAKEIFKDTIHAYDDFEVELCFFGGKIFRFDWIMIYAEKGRGLRVQTQNEVSFVNKLIYPHKINWSVGVGNIVRFASIGERSLSG
jgi:hypothetical protein